MRPYSRMTETTQPGHRLRDVPRLLLSWLLRCGALGACPFEPCGEVPIVPRELGEHPPHVGVLDLLGSLLFLVCKGATGPSCVPKIVVA